MTYEKNNASSQIKELTANISQISASINKTQEIIRKLDSTNPDGNGMMLQSMCEAEEKLEKLEIRQKGFEEEFQKFKNAETEWSILVKESIKEKFMLKKADQDKHPKPVVKIEGTIVAGTFVSGINSKIIINQNRSRVKIMEVKMSIDNIPIKNPWEMIIADL